jgi:hypothetical protein
MEEEWDYLIAYIQYNTNGVNEEMTKPKSIMASLKMRGSGDHVVGMIKRERRTDL